MEQRVRQATDAGFTLIELMVVVTILSLLTLTVGLGVNRPNAEQAQDWARFQSAYDQMRTRSILSGEVLGLALDAAGYARLARRGGAWADIGTPVRFRKPVAVLTTLDARAPVVFTPQGQSTALRLRFGEGADARLCQSDGWGPVTCDRI